MSELDELATIIRDANEADLGVPAGHGPILDESDYYPEARAVLAWLVDRDRAHEQQVRAKVAAEIEAVDPVEWALAGTFAGYNAARIARGDS